MYLKFRSVQEECKSIQENFYFFKDVFEDYIKNNNDCRKEIEKLKVLNMKVGNRNKELLSVYRSIDVSANLTEDDLQYIRNEIKRIIEKEL